MHIRMHVQPESSCMIATSHIQIRFITAEPHWLYCGIAWLKAENSCSLNTREVFAHVHLSNLAFIRLKKFMP